VTHKQHGRGIDAVRPAAASFSLVRGGGLVILRQPKGELELRLFTGLGCFAGLIGLLPGVALGQEGFVHPSPDSGWYLGVRAIAGASGEETSFRTLPIGAIGADEDSYNPQENFGAGAFVSYAFSGWRVPLRAELSGNWLYRHDADMMALGLANPYYENNLSIWDVRLSLLADVLDWGWGSLYFGGGLGAAFLDSEVSIVGISESADNSEWKLSPSAQAGLRFDDILFGADLELAYRFRWFGDTESGTFSDGAMIDYEDVHVHEALIGISVPIGR
jgi:opacity protein-like surface antigen